MYQNEKPKFRPMGQKGFTLIEQLVVLATVGIIVSLSAGALPKVTGIVKSANTAANLNILTDRLVAIIRDPISWNRTINDTVINLQGGNPSFQCWINGTTCAGVTVPRDFTPLQTDGLPVVIYDINGTAQRYNPHNNASHGMNFNGEFCNTFNSSSPNPNCPLRVTFTWRPLCSGPCIKPMIRVQMTFQYALLAGANPPVPAANLNKTIDIAGETRVVASTRCGNYRDAYGTVRPMAVVGINPDGTLQCMDGAALFGLKPPP